MIDHRRGAKSILLVSSLAGLIGVLGCRGERSIAEKPIEIQIDTSKAINLDEFRDQFAKAYRGPLHSHDRKAICAQPGTGAACVAKVTIQAIGQSHDIAADTAIARPRVIGQIRNLDQENTTEMYSLKPSSQAEYYIYIDNGPGEKARWNLLEVPVGQSGSIRQIAGNNITACNDSPGHPPQQSDVDFSKCGEHPLSAAEKKSGLIGAGGIRSLFFKWLSHFEQGSTVEAGEWMYCPTGCCT